MRRVTPWGFKSLRAHQCPLGGAGRRNGCNHRRLRWRSLKSIRGHQRAGVAELEDAPGLNPESLQVRTLPPAPIHPPVARRSKAPVSHAGISPFESGRQHHQRQRVPMARAAADNRVAEASIPSFATKQTRTITNDPLNRAVSGPRAYIAWIGRARDF